MAWQRLEEVYGIPEMIENALLKKVDDFPKITAKDNHKLRELRNILMELEAARANGYLPGFSCLNTSRGVSPIIQTLAHNLQERRLKVGTLYKGQNGASHPPFSVFVNSVCEQAKMCNDPSFASISAATLCTLKTEKSHLSSYRGKTPIDPDKLCTNNIASHTH